MSARRGSDHIVAETQVYGYSAYGETQALGVDGDIPNNSNQYTARENDELVGGTNGGSLYYYRARYYDPVLKRFISEDPIGLLGGLNFIAYVDGNPIVFNDPLGLMGFGGGGSSNAGFTRKSEPSSCQVEESPARNVCGANRGMPFPNSFPGGVNINSACAKHDRCYYAIWKAKAQCDREFLDDMNDLCQKSTSPGMCRAAAGVYYRGVDFGAGPARDAAQSEIRRANDFVQKMLKTGG